MDNEPSAYDEVIRRQQEQMLRLVTKGFYNELINYGVKKPDILTIASHLLDNVMQQEDQFHKPAQYYNRYFTTATLRDEWRDGQRLSVEDVGLAPLTPSLFGQVAAWLAAPGVRSSFITPFPEKEDELVPYFQDPARFYFHIAYRGQPVGIIGAENIDTRAARLEMRKLVGKSDLRGKGIGKRATFAFLYYVFMIQRFAKVYIHSTDINIRNLNLNSQFGFQLEGVFLQEIQADKRRQDMVRMGLMRPRWLEIFEAASGA
jgi:RimJ/RimL family protein N-acetyltransferase